jgi:hypothetical protein
VEKTLELAAVVGFPGGVGGCISREEQVSNQGKSRKRLVSKANREQKPDFPVCGCAGSGKPGTSGFYLRHLIDALDRMNNQPVVSDVKPVPDDERHRVRQARERAEFPTKGDE